MGIHCLQFNKDFVVSAANFLPVQLALTPDCSAHWGAVPQSLQDCGQVLDADNMARLCLEPSREALRWLAREDTEVLAWHLSRQPHALGHLLDCIGALHSTEAAHGSERGADQVGMHKIVRVDGWMSQGAGQIEDFF